MKVVVLAAGYGTRLGALGAETPKALLPLGEATLLDRLTEWVAECPGVERVVLVTNGRFHAAFRRWLRGSEGRFGFPIQVLDDGTERPEDRLGAVGDLVLGLDAAGEGGPSLVLGSDTLYDFPLERLGRALRGDRRWAAAVPIVREADPAALSRRGVAEVAADGRLVGFEEKPAVPRSSDTVPPIYLFRREAAEDVRRYLAAGGDADAPGSFLAWLVPRRPVLGVRMDGGRLDVGTPEGYRAALERFGGE